MTMSYMLLTGEDSSDFFNKVSLALSKGWKLYGDPQYNHYSQDNHHSQGSKMRCVQAVVKNISQDYDADIKLGD